MDIPSYPVFRKLEKDDKPIFDAAFRDYPPEISEFTFTNLYSWRQAYIFEVSYYKRLIIIRSSRQGQKRFFAPIGEGEKKEAVAQILSDSNAKLIRVDQDTKLLLEKDRRFTIIEDADNADYLYRAEDLIIMKGAKFDGKRNQIRQFKNKYAYDYITFDQSNIRACLDFEETWCTIKDCASSEGLSNERRAIREMVDNFSYLGFIAVGIRVENRICAVAFAELLNPRTLVMHILKADPNLTGLYQTMMQEFMQHQATAFDYVNLEQDLGIEGLRKSKLSYHPLAMVKKFTISISGA